MTPLDWLELATREDDNVVRADYDHIGVISLTYMVRAWDDTISLLMLLQKLTQMGFNVEDLLVERLAHWEEGTRYVIHLDLDYTGTGI